MKITELVEGVKIFIEGSGHYTVHELQPTSKKYNGVDVFSLSVKSSANVNKVYTILITESIVEKLFSIYTPKVVPVDHVYLGDVLYEIRPIPDSKKFSLVNTATGEAKMVTNSEAQQISSGVGK